MGSKPKAPQVVAAPDPQVEAQKAADLAAQAANDDTAARKKRKADSSLLTTGAQGSVLQQGKGTLGA
jgi:hypothetical protein